MSAPVEGLDKDIDINLRVASAFNAITVTVRLTYIDLEEDAHSQIKESYKEAGALRRKFDDDVSLIRRDADNRLAEHHRLAKKQQVGVTIFLCQHAASRDSWVLFLVVYNLNTQ